MRAYTNTLRTLLGAAALLGTTSLVDAQTLKVVPQADLKNVDPVWTTAAITQNHGYMVYDTPYAMDSNLEPQPQMVRSHEASQDNLTHTFTLRDDAFFSTTARRFEAKDVSSHRSNAGRSCKRADGQAMMDRLDSMEAVDSKTWKMTFKEPFGPLLTTLANPTLPLVVMREEEAQTDPNEQVTNIIGSGPLPLLGNRVGAGRQGGVREVRGLRAEGGSG